MVTLLQYKNHERELGGGGGRRGGWSSDARIIHDLLFLVFLPPDERI